MAVDVDFRTLSASKF